MSAIFPTGLPWQVKHDYDTEGRTTIIGNVDGEIIDGTTHHTYDFVATTLDETDDSQSRSIAVANAAFIVRACNDHAKHLARITQLEASNAQLEADRAELFDLVKRSNGAVNAAFAQSDAEWREHDKIAARHEAIVRQYLNDRSATLSRIGENGK